MQKKCDNCGETSPKGQYYEMMDSTEEYIGVFCFPCAYQKMKKLHKNHEFIYLRNKKWKK